MLSIQPITKNNYFPAMKGLGSVSTSEITAELNSRNYYSASASTSPSTSPSVSPSTRYLTRAEKISYATIVALKNYGYAAKASSKTYISSSTYNLIVEQARSIAEQLENQSLVYSTAYGLDGLRGLGASVYDNTDPALPEYQGWSSKYGPLLLKIAGSIVSITGEYYETAQLKKMYEDLGKTIPNPTTTDYANLKQLLVSAGYGADEAEAIANKTFTSSKATDETNAIPSWLIPAGLGLVALMVLQNQRKN